MGKYNKKNGSLENKNMRANTFCSHFMRWKTVNYSPRN